MQECLFFEFVEIFCLCDECIWRIMTHVVTYVSHVIREVLSTVVFEVQWRVMCVKTDGRGFHVAIISTYDSRS